MPLRDQFKKLLRLMRELGDLGEEEDDPTDDMSLSSDGKSLIYLLLF